jgi:hypothetical protein
VPLTGPVEVTSPAEPGELLGGPTPGALAKAHEGRQESLAELAVHYGPTCAERLYE